MNFQTVYFMGDTNTDYVSNPQSIVVINDIIIWETATLVLSDSVYKYNDDKR